MSDDPTPLTTCYELVKNENFINQFPNLNFSIGAGDKGDDPKRIKEFVNYFNKNPNLTNAKVSEHPPAKAHLVDGQPSSASRLRKAFTEQDWETFKKLLPNEAFYDDVVQILNNQGVGRVNENFLLAVSQSFLAEQKRKVAAKTKFLISKENTPAKQAYAIANSMADRGELEEELVTEEEEQVEEVRDKIRVLINNLIPNIDEILGSAAASMKDIFEPLADSITSQIVTSIASRAGEPRASSPPEETLEEMSGMAGAGGGSVEGPGGQGAFAFNTGEEDEQETTAA